MKNVLTKKIFFVLQVAFVYGFLANIGHPVTPAFLEELGLTSYFGYFLAAMNLGILLTAPLWGALGDVKNRKLMVCIGMIIYAIGQFMFGFFTTMPLIIIARLVAGIGNGAITVSMLSYISKSEILKDKRKEITSTYIVVNVIGASAGSALGGVIGDLLSNYNYVIYIQALLLLVYGFILFFFDNTNDEIKGEVRSKNPFNSLKDIKKVNSFYLIFLFVLFLIGISFTNITKYLDAYFNDLGYSTMFIGIFNLVVGVVTIIASVLILPKVNKKVDSYKGTIVFAIIAGVCVFLSFNIPNMIGIYSFYFLYIIAKTILEPLSVNTLSNNEVVPVGVLMGIRQSFISLGAIVGMIVAGYIYSYNNILLFNICGIIFIISALILVLIKNMKGR